MPLSRLRIRLLTVLASLAVVILLIPVLSPTIVSASPAPSPQPAVPINTQTLTEFFDQYITEQMETRQIVGALAAVVQNDHTIFSQGYGFSNIRENRLMDPASSVFRAASVSKLFTATALMQLAEKGLVDFDADINQYLKGFRIPETFSQPITITHLLTHTGGFDERNLQVRFPDPQRVTALREDLMATMPARVRPPGQVISYSNYGYALAGHIVELVSGLPFEEYVDQQIFKPLGMSRSSFAEPPSDRLRSDLVAMYSYRDRKHTELTPAYHNQRPAGALYSTVEDLARFAIAHLNEGRYMAEQLLSQESVKQMHTPQFTHHPELEGWGYGFNEIRRQGLRVIGHAGDLNGAYTFFVLIPDADLGVVFHVNTNVPTSLANDPRFLMLDRFVEHFFPDHSLNKPAQAPVATTKTTGLPGYYRVTRYSQKNPGKLLMPMTLAQLVVTQDPNGRVKITMPLGMIADSEWVPDRDGIYRRSDRETYLAYSQNNRGQVEFLYFTDGSAIAIERVAWYERYWVIAGLVVFALVVFVMTIIGCSLSSLVRRLWRKSAPVRSTESKWTRGLALCICLLGIGTAGVVGPTTLHIMNTLHSPLLFLLPAVSLAGWVMAVGSLLLVLLNARLWRSRQESFWQRGLQVLVAMAGISFAWVLYYGNLLGFTTL